MARMLEPLSRRVGRVGSAAVVLAGGCLVAEGVAFVLGLLAKTASLRDADLSLLENLATRRSGGLTDVMVTVTELGSYPVILTAALVAGVMLALLYGRWLPLPLLLLAIAAENRLRVLLIGVLDGDRPPDTLTIGPAGAFPSGGMGRIVLVFGLIAFFVGRERPRRLVRAVAATLVALLALLEAASRLYLGRHWAADLIGGLIWATLLLTTLTLAADLLLRPALSPDPEPLDENDTLPTAPTVA